MLFATLLDKTLKLLVEEARVNGCTPKCRRHARCQQDHHFQRQLDGTGGADDGLDRCTAVDKIMHIRATSSRWLPTS